MNADDKIEFLFDAVNTHRRSAFFYDASYLDLVTTKIGSRDLTAKACLGFALEIALEHRRARVPEIALRLVGTLHAKDQWVPLFGVDFPRDQIEAWSKQENLPTPVAVLPEQRAKDNTLGTPGSWSVHRPEVGNAGARLLQVMADRTPNDAKKTIEQTNAEIRQYLAAQPSPESAMKGLRKIMKYGGGLFNEDTRDILTTVWGYIEQWNNEEMKQNLRASMRLRLMEIDKDNPCSTGIIERLRDVPNGIDLSLPQEIKEEEVLRELAQIAGTINERFEENYEFDCTGSREAAGADENSPARLAVEAMISELKRDMFLQKARIELVFLRNIDPTFVMAVAERVFPKGATL